MRQRFRYARLCLALNLVFLSGAFLLWCSSAPLPFLGKVVAAEAAKPAPAQFDTCIIATPEWENQTNSNGTGLFFDLLRAVYEPAGISLQITLVPARRAILMLKQQEIDASLGFYAEEVGKRIGWNFYQTPKHPLMPERFVAIFKKENMDAWHFPGSLRNARVAWIAGYDFDNRIPVSLDYQKVTSPVQAWSLLNANRVDYYIDSESDSMAAARNLGVNLSAFHIESIWEDKMYPAFAQTKRGAYFMTVFDQRMKALQHSGELARLYAKWGVPLLPPE